VDSGGRDYIPLGHGNVGVSFINHALRSLTSGESISRKNSRRLYESGKTTILMHPDEVSGTTILGDGTKCHWTEGRSSFVTVAHPDGRKERIPSASTHPIILAINKVDEVGADEVRQMTPNEEAEWETARTNASGQQGPRHSIYVGLPGLSTSAGAAGGVPSEQELRASPLKQFTIGNIAVWYDPDSKMFAIGDPNSGDPGDSYGTYQELVDAARAELS
jgi:hypothetical protein